jgi:hypothetical protein
MKRLVYHRYTRKKQQLRFDLPYINQICTSNTVHMTVCSTYDRHAETKQLTKGGGGH